jgi:predicted SprT family Zn-dependent metalloprotease
MTNLGYNNEWRDVPEIVKNCLEHEHIVQVKNIAKSTKEYTCPLCDYKYKQDSSG